MAIEDNLDELYALFIANSVMSARMWGYFSALAAQSEGISQTEFLDRQARMSVQSVDLWDLGQNTRAPKIKQRAKDAVKEAFRGIIQGAMPGSRAQ